MSFSSQKKNGSVSKTQIKDRLRMIIDHTSNESIRTVERLVRVKIQDFCHDDFVELLFHH